MKKAIFAAFAVLALSLAGCTSPSPSPAGSPSAVDSAAPSAEASATAEPSPGEKLIVGLDDTFAPMGFRDEQNNLVGFDIDLAEAVGEVLNREIVFQPIDWDAKQMELDGKSIDCIWNGMSQTPEREEKMTLSKPYLDNKIIVMSQNKDVKSADELKGLKIGTQAASAALETLQAHEIYNDVKADVVEYKTYDECILDLQAGRIDVMVVDEVLGLYKQALVGEDKLSVCPFAFGEDYYVIGFRKADTALCAEVEIALKTLIENGKTKEISEKWFGKDIVLPLA